MKFVKSAKAKKVCEQVIEIGNAVIPYIEQAETFAHYSGEEKKAFVMTKANQYRSMCQKLRLSGMRQSITVFRHNLQKRIKNFSIG